MHLFRKQKFDIDAMYRKYGDSLYRLALGRLLNDHDAQDAVQDVFLNFMSKAPDFNDEVHEKAWFIRATVNRCNDLIRRRKIRLHVPLDEALGVQSHDNKDFLEVAELLEKLPDTHREAVVLHYLEGYKMEEVAEILEISLSAVKMRILRAKEILKKEQ